MDERQHNVQFVECVERYPCLWNFLLPQYSQRNVTEKAWEEVSREMKETASNCRERWKNIRNGLSRSLKPTASGSGARQKKEYYLLKHLQFLMPYMRKNPSTGNLDKANPNIHQEGNIELECRSENMHSENELEAFVAQNTCLLENLSDHGESEEVKLPEESSTQISNLLKKHDSEENKPTKRKIKKQNNINEVDSAFIEWMNSKKEKKENDNANYYFLKSLLPFMEEMTAKQNRRFRQKVVKLIDDIIEDQDVEERITTPVQSSSSSTLMDYAASPIFVLSPENC